VFFRMSTDFEAAHRIHCPTTQWTTVIQAIQSNNKEAHHGLEWANLG